MKCLIWTLFSLLIASSADRQIYKSTLDKLKNVEINHHTRFRSITHTKLDYDLIASWETIRNLRATRKIIIVPQKIRCHSSGCMQAIEIKIAGRNNKLDNDFQTGEIMKNSKNLQFQVITTKETVDRLKKDGLVHIYPIEPRCRNCPRRAFLTGPNNIALLVTNQSVQELRDKESTRFMENTVRRNLRSPPKSSPVRFQSQTTHRRTTSTKDYRRKPHFKHNRTMKPSHDINTRTEKRNLRSDGSLQTGHVHKFSNVQENIHSTHFGNRITEKRRAVITLPHKEPNSDSHISRVKQIMEERRIGETNQIINRAQNDIHTPKHSVSNSKKAPDETNSITTRNNKNILSRRELLEKAAETLGLTNKQHRTQTPLKEPLSRIRQEEIGRLQSILRSQRSTVVKPASSFNKRLMAIPDRQNSRTSPITSLKRSTDGSTKQIIPISHNNGISTTVAGVVENPVGGVHRIGSIGFPRNSFNQGRNIGKPIVLSKPFVGQLGGRRLVTNKNAKLAGPPVLLRPISHFTSTSKRHSSGNAGNRLTSPVVIHRPGSKAASVVQSGNAGNRPTSPVVIHRPRSKAASVVQSGLFHRRTNPWLLPQSGPSSWSITRSPYAGPTTKCCRNRCRSRCSHQRLVG